MAVLLAAVAVLAGRLVQVQGLEGPRYAALARMQRLHVIPLPAMRGEITDRNGEVLAESVYARDVYADPEQIQAAAKLAPTTLGRMTPTQIADALTGPLGIPVAKLLAVFAEHEQFVYLVRGLTPKAGNRIQAMNLPGIGVLDSTRRVYPNGTLAASVLGFTGFDGSGLAGLEYAQNRLLTGTPGRIIVETGADGRVIPDSRNVDIPARPGSGLELTLDRDIQWKTQQALAAEVKATGAESGIALVMNPRNGQILALANVPSFNPNNPGASPPADLGDAAATQIYEPGSINKVITMSAALQEGLFTPLTPITIPPTLTVNGTVFHDAEVHGTEHLTLTGVLAQSSNIGTIEVAQKVGAPTVYRYLRAYGLGQPTGCGLPGEAAGIVPPLSQWSGTTLPTIAFGQGLAVTALQMAQVYATIANGGVRIAPHIVRAVIGPGGHLRPVAPPTPKRIVSAAVAKELARMLEAVTTTLGTAPAARIPGYRVAGKTGTANLSNGHGRYSGYTASFIGFAPANNPQLLVEVVLRRPKTSIYGGSVSAPVFHQVMSFALQSLHVAPVGPAPLAQIYAP
ncbi:MAG: peptidoglycan D,D-transpeptidase FtsI family protein [Mycobacteriales bacterium]